ncbi:MAG: FKBP-type peptidyl-prolyl cis-trans isomerase [Xanthomonadales bacterium]|nr:FKBP-type peptidyl-prolyl cis-trans isomerase [Xanthomonadales bacterium]
MSIRWMAALVAGVWSITALAQQAAPQQQLPAMDKNKLSYALGFQIGTDMRERGLDVDIATVVRALQEGHANSQPSVPMEEMVGQLAAMEDKLRKEAEAKFNTLAAENKAKSDRFLAENRAKKGIIVLPSGIQYRVIEEGNGARPSPTSDVVVHYRGSLISGFEFDSSFARNQPANFKVDQVLTGWREILPLMRVGDQWQVFLPPEQAYGERGPRPIGPNQALIFDIKLLEIK